MYIECLDQESLGGFWHCGACPEHVAMWNIGGGSPGKERGVLLLPREGRGPSDALGSGGQALHLAASGHPGEVERKADEGKRQGALCGHHCLG